MKVQKIELSEEMSAALNEKLQHISKGMAVAVTYHSDGEYIARTGKLESIDLIAHLLRIAGQYVSFEDLLDVDIPESIEEEK